MLVLLVQQKKPAAIDEPNVLKCEGRMNCKPNRNQYFFNGIHYL